MAIINTTQITREQDKHYSNMYKTHRNVHLVCVGSSLRPKSHSINRMIHTLRLLFIHQVDKSCRGRPNSRHNIFGESEDLFTMWYQKNIMLY